MAARQGSSDRSCGVLKESFCFQTICEPNRNPTKPKEAQRVGELEKREDRQDQRPLALLEPPLFVASSRK